MPIVDLVITVQVTLSQCNRMNVYEGMIFTHSQPRHLMGMSCRLHSPAPLTQRKVSTGRSQLKYDGTSTETRFRLSAKRTSPFQSAGASVLSTTCSRGVRISGSNAGYVMFRGSVKSTGYPLHSPVSPSLPLPCGTMCHQVSVGVYALDRRCDGPQVRNELHRKEYLASYRGGSSLLTLSSPVMPYGIMLFICS